MLHRSRALLVVAAGLLTLVFMTADRPVRAADQVAQAATPAAAQPPKPLALEDALKKARADGKYEMLLRQFKAEDDWKTQGEFRDFGPRNLSEHAGQRDLPRGSWVYVYPYWYIWRDLSAAPKLRRAWGTEQATGEPDTDGAGDIQTAWASLSPDAQDEWLMTEYAEPVVPKAIVIHETYNPGAVVRVTVYKLDGTEVEVWKGQDPTGTDADRGISVIPIKVDYKVNRVRIFIDSVNVPGWNEIDAIGLRDAGNKTQWALAAHASSTYAQQAAPEPPPPAPVIDRATMLRIERLENEVRELKESLKRVEELLKKKDSK